LLKHERLLPVSSQRSKTVIFNRLFRRNAADPSEALYATIVAAARQEKFYADWKVPDTLDGRFDVLVIHMYLALNRFKDFGAESAGLRQALTDRFFAQMDAALREVGVGDLTVGKKVRKMAEAFFGRVTAYSEAIEKPDDTLQAAVARNVFASNDASHASNIADWMRNAKTKLQGQDFEDLAAGRIKFE
jgi:cytochrome b pre-mRNA-processing protein 3